MRVERRLPHRSRRTERGSALVLIPVLMLIMVMAAGLVLDSAVGFTAKRALVDTAATAANDAANGLESNALYESGTVQLDSALVERIAQRAIATRSDGLTDVRLVSAQVVTKDGRPAVEVAVTGTTRRLFGVFGDGKWHLDASVVSIARQDG
jgi:Flp pilus assembly protein TadG